MTFSIVARSGVQYGVAVASKFLAVGSVVGQVRLGVGAVASQAMANTSYNAALLDRLERDPDAAAALDEVTAADRYAQIRQVGVISATGAATFTGTECLDHASGVAAASESEAYAIQGNILSGPQVVETMERTWLESRHLPFVMRLLAVLSAGDHAGGDARGRQSAAVYAMAPGAGYDQAGLLADLRVDDHADPVAELQRLAVLNELYTGAPTLVLPLVGPLREDVETRLGRLGYSGDVEASLRHWIGVANLETRLTDDGIDVRVLQMLREASIPPPPQEDLPHL